MLYTLLISGKARTLWLLGLLGLPALAQGQPCYPRALLEYKDTAGFWNRVVELPDYCFPQGPLYEDYYPVMGYISPQGDTTMGAEPHPALTFTPSLPGTNADTAVGLPDAIGLPSWHLVVDTAAGWQMLHPAAESDRWKSTTVYAVVLRNDSPTAQALPLYNGALMMHRYFLRPPDYQHAERELRSPLSWPSATAWVLVPSGGAVITLLHPFQAGPDGAMESRYTIIQAYLPRQTVRSQPFLAYW